MANPFSITLVKGWGTQYLNQPDRNLGRNLLTEDEMWPLMVKRGKNQEAGPYGLKPDFSAYERRGGDFRPKSVLLAQLPLSRKQTFNLVTRGRLSA